MALSSSAVCEPDAAIRNTGKELGEHSSRASFVSVHTLSCWQLENWKQQSPRVQVPLKGSTVLTWFGGRHLSPVSTLGELCALLNCTLGGVSHIVCTQYISIVLQAFKGTMSGNEVAVEGQPLQNWHLLCHTQQQLFITQPGQFLGSLMLVCPGIPTKGKRSSLKINKYSSGKAVWSTISREKRI